MGARRHNHTLSQRGTIGQTMARKVAKLPVERKHKASILRAKVVPASFYGIEIADYTEREYSNLTVAVMGALTANAAKKDVDWVFQVASFGDDLDPTCITLTRRCLALRRTLAKKPHLLAKYQAIYDGYRAKRSAATLAEDYTKLELSKLEPAPHPTVASRSKWKSAIQPGALHWCRHQFAI